MKGVTSARANPQQFELVSFILLSFTIMVFLVIRAIRVPMNHDEVTTFYNYVQRCSFLPFLAPAEANNHPLNSFLSILFYHVFGSSSLSLRLSNLIAAPLYFYFCYKLSRELFSALLRWIFIGVMMITFPVLEFFALSRGYGLSVTFLLGAVWQVFLARNTGTYRHLVYCNLFMILSCLSILLEITNFALLFGWSVIMTLSKPGPGKFKALGWIVLSGLPALVFFTLFTFHLQSMVPLMEKGPTGIWDASLKTLFIFITHMNSEQVQILLICLTALLSAVLLLTFMIAMLKKRFIPNSNLLFIYLLSGNILITLLVVKLLFSAYHPESRLVLFLFPLIAGSIIFTLDLSSRLASSRIIALLAIPLLFFPINSLKAINFEYISWYKSCHIPMRFYDTIMKDNKVGDLPPVLAGGGTQAWVWSYICRQRGSKANEISTIDFRNGIYPYEILNLNYFNSWRDHYNRIDFDPISNLSLLKNKASYSLIPLSENKYEGNRNRTRDEASLILKNSINDFMNKRVQLELDMTFDSYQQPFYGLVVISVNDSSDQNLIYDEIHLNWIREVWDGTPHNFRRSWILPELPKTASYLKIHLWDVGKSEYSIKDAIIRFSELRPI
jgi:hypothetical protein